MKKPFCKFCDAQDNNHFHMIDGQIVDPDGQLYLPFMRDMLYEQVFSVEAL